MIEVPFEDQSRWQEFAFSPHRKTEEGEWPEHTAFLYELTEGQRFMDTDERSFTYVQEGPVQGACVVTRDGFFAQFDSSARVFPIPRPEEVVADADHQRRSAALLKLAAGFDINPDSPNTSGEDLAMLLAGENGVLHPWVAVTEHPEDSIYYFYPAPTKDAAKAAAEMHIGDPLFAENPVEVINLDTNERVEAELRINWLD